MKKKHLTEGQRYKISAYLQDGKSQKEIARILGFNRSNISREVKRNADGRSGSYHPDLAQRKYRKRMEQRTHHKSFTDALKLQVDILLTADLSPEQIAGCLKRSNMEYISHETIYLYVWQDKKYGNKQLYTHLRRRGRHYKKRGYPHGWSPICCELLSLSYLCVSINNSFTVTS